MHSTFYAEAVFFFFFYTSGNVRSNLSPFLSMATGRSVWPRRRTPRCSSAAVRATPAMRASPICPKLSTDQVKNCSQPPLHPTLPYPTLPHPTPAQCSPAQPCPALTYTQYTQYTHRVPHCCKSPRAPSHLVRHFSAWCIIRIKPSTRCKPKQSHLLMHSLVAHLQKAVTMQNTSFLCIDLISHISACPDLILPLFFCNLFSDYLTNKYLEFPQLTA